jgi:hypothetical protein
VCRSLGVSIAPSGLTEAFLSTPVNAAMVGLARHLAEARLPVSYFKAMSYGPRIFLLITRGQGLLEGIVSIGGEWGHFLRGGPNVNGVSSRAKTKTNPEWLLDRSLLTD